MPRQQLVNSFIKGMYPDANEQQASNEALTDAINATIVTGNGDHLILQNDMGNSEITDPFNRSASLEDRKAKLPDGYLPLANKEINGASYMVLSNGKDISIGSFPGVSNNHARVPADTKKDWETLNSYQYDSNNNVTRICIFDQDQHKLKAWNEDQYYEFKLISGTRFRLQLPKTLAELSDTDLFDDVHTRYRWYSIDFELRNKFNNIIKSTDKNKFKRLPYDKDTNPDNNIWECNYLDVENAESLYIIITKHNVTGCSVSKVQIHTDDEYNGIEIPSGYVLLNFLFNYEYNCADDIIGDQVEYQEKYCVLNGAKFDIAFGNTATGDKKQFTKYIDYNDIKKETIRTLENGWIKAQCEVYTLLNINLFDNIISVDYPIYDKFTIDASMYSYNEVSAKYKYLGITSESIYGGITPRGFVSINNIKYDKNTMYQLNGRKLKIIFSWPNYEHGSKLYATIKFEKYNISNRISKSLVLDKYIPSGSNASDRYDNLDSKQDDIWIDKPYNPDTPTINPNPVDYDIEFNQMSQNTSRFIFDGELPDDAEIGVQYRLKLYFRYWGYVDSSNTILIQCNDKIN